MITERLGRKPSPADPRDYQLADYLGADPLQVALGRLTKSHLVPSAVKTWAKLVTAALEGTPTPSPTPTPSSVTSWLDDDDPVLDQGQTGHCVGFTGADWENALPVDDHVQNAAGDDIYYACKVVDGEPQQEDGSTIRSLAKVLKAHGKLTTYAFASSIDDVWSFVGSQGPVCWGIGWTDSMFTPDKDGFVVPSGPDVGGHAIIQYGIDGDTALMLNHWGTSWGDGGRFKMSKADLAERLSSGGEAMAAVEVQMATAFDQAGVGFDQAGVGFDGATVVPSVETTFKVAAYRTSTSASYRTNTKAAGED